MKVLVIAVTYGDEIVFAYAGRTGDEIAQKIVTNLKDVLEVEDVPSTDNVFDWLLNAGYKYEVFKDEIKEE